LKRASTQFTVIMLLKSVLKKNNERSPLTARPGTCLNSNATMIHNTEQTSASRKFDAAGGGDVRVVNHGLRRLAEFTGTGFAHPRKERRKGTDATGSRMLPMGSDVDGVHRDTSHGARRGSPNAPRPGREHSRAR
jgi:hypothetical protein